MSERELTKEKRDISLVTELFSGGIAVIILAIIMPMTPYTNIPFSVIAGLLALGILLVVFGEILYVYEARYRMKYTAVETIEPGKDGRPSLPGLPVQIPADLKVGDHVKVTILIEKK